MKRITLLLIMVGIVMSASAQTLSLADALARLNQQQDDY